MEELKRIMSPELLNRIDDVVVFNALSRKEISSILDIQIKELENRLAEKNIVLSIKPKARDYLLDNGYEPSLGARPMRRLIQKEIEDPLSMLLLDYAQEPSQKQSTVIVDFAKNSISVSLKKAQSAVKKQKESSKKIKETELV